MCFPGGESERLIEIHFIASRDFTVEDVLVDDLFAVDPALNQMRLNADFDFVPFAGREILIAGCFIFRSILSVDT